MRKKNLVKIIVLLGLVLTPVLASVNSVSAAALSSVKDVLSDSGPSVVSNHAISFEATSGIAAGNTINLVFDDVANSFNFGSVAYTDMDMSSGTCGSETADTLGTTASGSTWGVTVNATTDEITITSGTDTVTAGGCVVVLIGTNATGGVNQMTNPTAGVYGIDVETTSDSGSTLVAILSHVAVDVTVDETLTFTVTGQGTTDCTTNTTTLSTASAVSFGSVNEDSFYTACQELLVSTNASNGYSVTVQQDEPLTSDALDTIAAGSCDGACTVTTAGAWATNTNNGFAYTLANVTGTDA